MSVNTYDIGDTTTLTGSFANSDGEATDPTAIQLLIRTPAGVETEYTYSDDITRDAEGEYSMVYELTESGTYYYRWVGSGSIVCASEGFLKVRPSRFTNPLP